jgi:hypothetical protein
MGSDQIKENEPFHKILEAGLTKGQEKSDYCHSQKNTDHRLSYDQEEASLY